MKKRLILVALLALIVLLLLACNPVINLPTATPTVTLINVTNTVTSHINVTNTVTPICTVNTGYEAGTLWFRSAPGTEFGALRVLIEGETLFPTSEVSGIWKQVQDTIGQIGWVNSNFISCLGE